MSGENLRFMDHTSDVYTSNCIVFSFITKFVSFVLRIVFYSKVLELIHLNIKLKKLLHCLTKKNPIISLSKTIFYILNTKDTVCNTYE